MFYSAKCKFSHEYRSLNSIFIMNKVAMAIVVAMLLYLVCKIYAFVF